MINRYKVNNRYRIRSVGTSDHSKRSFYDQQASPSTTQGLPVGVKMEGKLHSYHKRGLSIFEYHPNGHQPPSTNVLLFIGGMRDHFLHPTYVTDLAFKLVPLSWSVMHAQLSSAGTQYGMSSLDVDVEQMGAAVATVKEYVASKGTASSEGGPVNIVLMGHSTGCQDLLHYVLSPVSEGRTRPPVQGIILQGPVSDRDAMYLVLDSDDGKTAYKTLLNQANAVPQDQWKSTILPFSESRKLMGSVPMSIYRFHSLVSPDSPDNPADDDLLSSDLSDAHLQTTFGRVGQSKHLEVSSSAKNKTKPQVLILISGHDEGMPPQMDKEVLLGRWGQALAHGGAALHPDSGIVPKAEHDVGGDDEDALNARKDLVRRVTGYLDAVVGLQKDSQGEEPLDLRGLKTTVEETGGDPAGRERL